MGDPGFLTPVFRLYGIVNGARYRSSQYPGTPTKSIAIMRVANPIYDTVFKYLMEDNQLAKLLLSTILNEEITALTFRPQERTTEVGSRYLTVYRLDFAATVVNAAGEQRQVLIEIQKAKLAADIMRFRRYLGEQYRDPNNIKDVKPTESERKTRQALPLLTIYFLGHALEHTEAPVIRVRRESYDLTTGEKLKLREPFIESLTHDSYVIQIPHLRSTHRTEVEELLQLFDQGNISSDDKHFLEIDESEVAERYRPLLRRLQRAVAEPEVAEAMELEDEVLEELQSMEREIEAKEQEIEANNREIETKDREIDAKEQEIEDNKLELQKERPGKEVERKEKERLLAILKQAGIKP